jgi:hypothetical protein
MYDATFGFELPQVASPAVCEAADFAQLQANFNGAQKWSDLVNGLAPACADCVLTPKGAPNYGPLVTISADGTQGFSNFGACFAHYTKANGATDADATACGKSMNYTELCIREACDCAITDAEQTVCIQKALGTGGVCRPFGTGLSACNLTGAQENYCNSLINGARVLCGGGGI